MRYCQACGSEVDEEASFCPECGDPITASEDNGVASEKIETSDNDEVEKGTGSKLNALRPTNWKFAVVGIVFGLIIGGVAALATSNIGGSGVFFAIGLLGGAVFLWRMSTVSGAVGSGLYITALLLILTPILFYTPMVIGGGEAEGAAEAGQFIGGVLGLIIWGFVFFLVALVVAGIGYFFKRREAKMLA